jgi:hypothetical protein
LLADAGHASGLRLQRKLPPAEVLVLGSQIVLRHSKRRQSLHSPARISRAAESLQDGNSSAENARGLLMLPKPGKNNAKVAERLRRVEHRAWSHILNSSLYAHGVLEVSAGVVKLSIVLPLAGHIVQRQGKQTLPHVAIDPELGDSQDAMRTQHLLEA